MFGASPSCGMSYVLFTCCPVSRSHQDQKVGEEEELMSGTAGVEMSELNYT